MKIQQFIKAQNGEILKCADRKIVVKCENGHIWTDDAQMCKIKKWCKQCTKVSMAKQKYETKIQRIQNIIDRKRGQILKCDEKKMVVKCAKGHIWIDRTQIIKAQRWCKKCKNNKIIQQYIDQRLRRVQDLVNNKNGQIMLLTSQNIILKCQRKHIWIEKCTPIDVSKWCRECKYVEKQEIQQRTEEQKKQRQQYLLNLQQRLFAECASQQTP